MNSPLQFLTALLLAPAAFVPDAEMGKPSHPTVFTAYYGWYHTGEHLQRPLLAAVSVRGGAIVD